MLPSQQHRVRFLSHTNGEGGMAGVREKVKYGRLWKGREKEREGVE